MHDAFVSHSSRDKQTADALVHYLESRSIRCWVAPRDIAPGKSYAEGILDGLTGANVMILVLSASANTSSHVQREVERALSMGKSVIPVRVEDIKPSGALDYFISSVHWIDAFEPPVERHFQTLADHIGALARVAGPAEGEGGPPVQPVQPVQPIQPIQPEIFAGAGPSLPPQRPVPAPVPADSPQSQPAAASGRLPLVAALALALVGVAVGGWILHKNALAAALMQPAEGRSGPVGGNGRSNGMSDENTASVFSQELPGSREVAQGEAGERALLPRIEALVARAKELGAASKSEAGSVVAMAALLENSSARSPEASAVEGRIDAAIGRIGDHRVEVERILAQIEVLVDQAGGGNARKLAAPAAHERDLIVSQLTSSQERRGRSRERIAEPVAIPTGQPPKVATNTPAEGASFANGIGLQMVWVPGISGWVDAHELTQGAYEKVTSINPSTHRGSSRLPVDSVSWNDANQFCAKLTDGERRNGTLPEGFVCRLPSDGEWTAFSKGTARGMAVFSGSRASRRSAPLSVGTLAANPQGLYDVLGNIYEWCYDDFDKTMNSSSDNATMSGLAPGGKVVRGGSFQSYTPTTQKLSFRASDRAAERHHTVGFRVVLARPIR